MKKLLMLCISIASSYYILAQDISDAVRYSMDEIQGTARFRAMSGAFGALGGDMSAVNINPAGSAIFNNSHTSVSIGVFNKNDDINYFNGFTSASNSNFDLNQFGATFVFVNRNESSPWKKFTLSAAYDRSADFDDDWVATGVNPNNSIGSYFLLNAQGKRLDEISAFTDETISQAYSEIGSFYGFENQQAFLGYEGFIIDPVENTDENTAYTSNIDLNGTDYNQEYYYSSRGYTGKLAFNLATSYEDKIFLGINLNAHFINYERSTFLNETNSNTNSTITNVDFENNLLTTGSGFSFQLGGIAKVTEEFRVGLSFNSPTWFRISEETSQYLATTSTTEGNTILNPNVVNIFPEYRLQTPSKLTGSLAYVFGKQGLLSFDYSIKDYSNTKFRPTSDTYFSALNNSISNTLDTANSYRVGGEYRYKQLSFRGGYRFEESPYKDDTFFGDLTGYSLGLGYNFGNINLDLAFSQAERDTNYQLYNVGLTDSAQFESKFTDVILTLGFKI
ncbi:OmpP1/FadL family transporter [Winogradskyella algicola]|uniref:OmpP1/FadL family transporter n=1 Tax=Winogradskyella algicola TaxID=2575815 RepID=UPI001107CD55|nr:outer membrane protein transport protein [Winogradskyella algicola]